MGITVEGKLCAGTGGVNGGKIIGDKERVDAASHTLLCGGGRAFNKKS